MTSDHRAPAIQPVAGHDPLALAGRKVLARQSIQLHRNLHGTLMGQDPEFLHDFRVATRRARAALRLFGDVLGQRRADELRRELGWIADLLGEVRDLDVLEAKLPRQLDRAEVTPESRRRLAEWLDRRRRLAEGELADGLGSNRFERLLSRLDRLAGAPPPARLDATAAMTVARAGPKLIQQAWRRAAKAGRRARRDPKDEALHRLRIRLKRVRYTVEFLSHGLPGDWRHYLKRLKQLQDLLGDLQDAVVASNLLRDFLTWGTWGHKGIKRHEPLPTVPVVAPGVAAYLTARQVELQHLLDTFPEAWAQVRSPEFRQLVAAALTSL